MMALKLIDRHLRSKRTLSADEIEALRELRMDRESEDQWELSQDVLQDAHDRHEWIACDCRKKGGRKPAIAPCLGPSGVYYTRALVGKQHLAHDGDCLFHPSRSFGLYERLWNRKPRKAPDRLFEVLRNDPVDGVRSRNRRPAGARAKSSSLHRPMLSQQLLRLVQSARINTVGPQKLRRPIAQWLGELTTATQGIEIAPGRALSEFWFTQHWQWKQRKEQARLLEAAGDWPDRHRPQAFLCWPVEHADAEGVGRKDTKYRVNVAGRVKRPMIRRKAVPGPYLFIGALGIPRGESQFRCMEAYAQPIVSLGRPIPVDSDYERKAYGQLTGTLQRLQEAYSDADFTISKPVFESEGPCLPDFLVHARRADEERDFVIEVMGFERVQYLQQKERTHERMARLGPLYTMEGKKFNVTGGLEEEGEKITENLLRELGRTWMK